MRTCSMGLRVGAAAVALALAAACSDDSTPTAPTADLGATAAPAPAPLVTAAYAGGSLELWPYTTYDFVTPQDPVNLLFVGNADPRTVRAALLSVDEDHSGFPVPLACRWQDVPEGSVQAAYATDAGWSGSTIQLACGDYGALRFHLRLFAAGEWTIANAHVEFLIEGTTSHQVLSWEVAEQFVLYDLVRSGLAVPVGASSINDAPAFRTIDAQIVGLIAGNPAGALLLAIACPPGVPLPWACDGSSDVGILTDGMATIVSIDDDPGAATGSFSRTQTIQFDQTIPKPFCVDVAFPYIYVVGPIELREHWVLTPSNNYIAQFEATGTLYLTPVNPQTGETGDTYLAEVYEKHKAMLTDHQNKVANVEIQAEIPADSPFRGTLMVEFSVGPDGTTSYDASIVCGSG